MAGRSIPFTGRWDGFISIRRCTNRSAFIITSGCRNFSTRTVNCRRPQSESRAWVIRSQKTVMKSGLSHASGLPWPGRSRWRSFIFWPQALHTQSLSGIGTKRAASRPCLTAFTDQSGGCMSTLRCKSRLGCIITCGCRKYLIRTAL
jgi:hypothetical protein